MTLDSLTVALGVYALVVLLAFAVAVVVIVMVALDRPDAPGSLSDVIRSHAEGRRWR